MMQLLSRQVDRVGHEEEVRRGYEVLPDSSVRHCSRYWNGSENFGSDRKCRSVNVFRNATSGIPSVSKYRSPTSR
jgi:hypothetical protein